MSGKYLKSLKQTSEARLRVERQEQAAGAGGRSQIEGDAVRFSPLAFVVAAAALSTGGLFIKWTSPRV